MTPAITMRADAPVLTRPVLHNKSAKTNITTTIPRLGFIGTGRLGRLRMQALMDYQNALTSPLAHFDAVFDPSPEAAQEAAKLSARTHISSSLDELLEMDLDGVVIATPSALHADQCVAALESGKAVFCQKPLARTSAETARVIHAARLSDKLLAVDFSYHYLQGMHTLRELIAKGDLGEVFAVDLVFHNANGPDNPWCYDMTSAGGGCVMDLGIQLVDLVMWLMNSNEVNQLSSTLFHQGKKLRPPYKDKVEDYAIAEFGLGNTRVRLTCSWHLHSGQDAVIEAQFHGTHGGAAVRNVAGSFYDFEIYHHQGASSQRIAGYPDSWGGRALANWINRLARCDQYDPQVEQALHVAQVIDRIYCR